MKMIRLHRRLGICLHHSGLSIQGIYTANEAGTLVQSAKSDAALPGGRRHFEGTAHPMLIDRGDVPRHQGLPGNPGREWAVNA